ncbi:MAG: plasmid recombination protein [Prevotellaceae bacterium]|jgi:hypothetical protein|nr:plasmid recombination protein [Prevotellaceae bacterium]
MGYAVLHLEKGAGNDAPISSHIERTVEPKNADKNRTHLNRELIEFPDGVGNRTEAIQYRIEHAGITRKISHNQVRAIRVMLSGSPDGMQRIEKTGQLDNWCSDSIDWLKKTFGAENLVSAVLHLDEKTPHIHATVIPVVTGERRKARKEQPEKQKKYKKKPANAAHLCADDVMARNKLKEYQDSYAGTVNKYGLQRGVDGSEARHISTQQYYRELVDKNEKLKEDSEVLQEQKDETYEKVRDLYDLKDEAQDKFLDMDRHLHEKKQELNTIENKLQKAKQDYEPYKAQEELSFIYDLFSPMKEYVRIADLCQKIGFTIDAIRRLLKGVVITVNDKLYSPEHNQHFEAKDLKAQIEKEPDNPNKLRLNLNGMNILEWFREKFQEMRQAVGNGKKQANDKSRQMKM